MTAENNKFGVLESLTLKTQIIIAYGGMAAVVCAVSIALSVIMINNLSTAVYLDSHSILVSQSLTNAQDLASELGDTAAQQLTVLGTSINKVSARFTKILLTTTDPVRPNPTLVPFKMLKPFPSFAEFNFTGGCAVRGGCPADYGSLSARSRFPFIAGAESGSLVHSSTYLYSSAQKRSLRSDELWTAELKSSQALSDVTAAIAAQNEDQMVMYSNNGTVLSFLYLAAKITNSSGQHTSLLSTFPGVIRNLSTYDPATRAWFASAESESAGTTFYGPYVEPFANQRVVMLSSKQSFNYLNHTVEVVSASAVSVSSFRDLVMSIPYINGGFAAIFNKHTLEVLAWGNRTDLVAAGASLFRTLHDIDPRLPADVCAEAFFDYTDEAGTEWLGGCADSFSSTVALSALSSVSGSALTTIVFVQKALAVQPLNALQDKMDSSARLVLSTVLIVVLGVSFVVLVLVLAAVWNITSPLGMMRRVALQVIEVMAEDEEARDFAPVLNQAGFNVSRTDEVGVLACDFYQVMCLMHNKVVERRAVAKYPPNPWHLECEEENSVVDLSNLTWQDLRGVAASRPVQPPPSVASRMQVVTREAAVETSSAVPASTKASIMSSNKMSMRTSNKVSHKASLLLHFSGKVKPLEVDQLATIAQSRPVGWLTCLRTQLSVLATLQVLAVVGAMMTTILTVRHDGSTWSDQSANAVTAKQLTNLRSIAMAKSTFVLSFFSQMTMDTRTVAAVFTSALMGDLSTPTWEADGQYLHSYSSDKANPYSIDPRGPPYPFSSYWVPTDANCSTVSPPTCNVTHKSSLSRITSLMDIKVESLIYPKTYMTSTLSVHDATGYTRMVPMWYVSTFAVPTLCWPNTKDIPFCADMIKYSKCGNASLPTYPIFDSRCRSWYALSRQFRSTEQPTFAKPRLSADGAYVLTTALNIANRTTGERIGGMTMNFLLSTLIASAANNPIMTHGYSYIVDVKSVDSVIIHPRQTFACTTVKCVEGMTSEEYAVLKNTVLLGGSSAKESFEKGGQVWRVATHPVRYGNIDYLLVATVPEWEIVEFATNARNTINQSTQKMVVGFGVAIAVVVTCMMLVIAAVVRLIMKPLDDLRLVIGLALRKDFTKTLPKQAGSADMAALMTAITQLLVALRLDACSGESADIGRTHTVFVDSVELFKATGNRKGLGASLSNLAALELAMGNIASAKEHYEQSVELAKELLSQLEAAAAGGGARVGDEEAALLEDELRRARRVVSDRQGGLALTLLEALDLAGAAALLGSVLTDDKRNMHIRGCVMKQSALGHAYLRTKQLADAEQVFSASLRLVRGLQESATVRGSAMSEADACEMLALFDLAALAEARSWRTSLESVQELEHLYLAALMVPAHMELGTARRVLRSLLTLYGRHPQFGDAWRLVLGIADSHKLNLVAGAVEGMAVAKRMMLVLDYSISMSGSRMRSLKDCLHTFMKEHVHSRDSVGILSFNNSVQEVLPLTVKASNGMHMAKRVESLVAPVGGTALYDGVLCALKALNPVQTGDWMVVLADGADDKSKGGGGLQEVLREVAASRVSVVALGIGPEAPEDVLQLIAQASRRGFCVCLPATKVDISDLFAEVARVVQSTQVVLEEY